MTRSAKSCGNNGGKAYARCEAHLVYRTGGKDGTKVTFAWTDDGGEHKDSRTFVPGPMPAQEQAWAVATGKDVRTRWVDFEAVAR